MTHTKKMSDFLLNSRCFFLESSGEPGELVGKIVKGNPVREFDGYLDSKASSKKVITNVFKKGDQAFSTGMYLVCYSFHKNQIFFS